MAETNGDVKECLRCHILENQLWEASELLLQERAAREGIEIAADFDDTAMRLDTLYREREVKVKDEIEARLKLLPLRAKLIEIEEKTENIKAQRGLIQGRTAQAKLNQLLTQEKIKKMQLENAEREAMIELYAAAVDAVERLGTGNMVEADFEVLDSLKQIGVKIPKNLKVVKKIPKQTNGCEARKWRAMDGLKTGGLPKATASPEVMAHLSETRMPEGTGHRCETSTL